MTPQTARAARRLVRVRGARETQPQERRPRHPARRAGGVHRRFGLGEVVAGVRHALRGGAAPLSRIGLALRAAADPPGRRCPRSTRSRGCRPRSPCSSSAAAPTTRSSVGSVTTLSNLLRMLYSRAGTYPRGQPHAVRRGRSRRTPPQGACPTCHGLGRVYEVTERSMVPDDSLTIRERAIAAWPPAWHGQNLRDILVTLGLRRRPPWRELPKKDRDWILFTDEQPTVPVYAGLHAGGDAARAQAQGGAELPGHLHRRAQVRAADLRHHAERAHEEARARAS